MIKEILEAVVLLTPWLFVLVVLPYKLEKYKKSKEYLDTFK